jgi:hypothetical protein
MNIDLHDSAALIDAITVGADGPVAFLVGSPLSSDAGGEGKRGWARFTKTTRKRIEPHRLAALMLEDLQRYPQSAISDIHQRIDGEIHPKQFKRALEELTAEASVRFKGYKRWCRYWAAPH